MTTTQFVLYNLLFAALFISIFMIALVVVRRDKDSEKGQAGDNGRITAQERSGSPRVQFTSQLTRAELDQIPLARGDKPVVFPDPRAFKDRVDALGLAQAQITADPEDAEVPQYQWRYAFNDLMTYYTVSNEWWMWAGLGVVYDWEVFHNAYVRRLHLSYMDTLSQHNG